jgi:putative alpha-1,2-mannosidase
MYVLHCVYLQDVYIQRAFLNGEEYDCAFIAHGSIVSGGVLTLEMGSTPNITWANTGRKCLEEYHRRD